ncbi:MAG: NADPH-dependent F420 reductase [Actinobacteria bacterium]|nr:NADPH-dependent F420 reductase [Actinomycetota bacterium]MCL6105517.1 NADPH-dependent F420 reductase [Actinomycetota bacterium]
MITQISNVGILGGTGPAGRGLALRIALAGIPVVLGSRSAEKAQGVVGEMLKSWSEFELAITGADNPTAALGEVVVVATPWESAAYTVGALRQQLNGKVVVCMANALAKVGTPGGGSEIQALGVSEGSIANAVQGGLPESKVVGAFHHLPAEGLVKLDAPLDSDVLLCSDHLDAIEVVEGLVEKIPGLRPLRAGSLAQSAAIEAFTAVLVALNRNYKAYTALRITGI